MLKMNGPSSPNFARAAPIAGSSGGSGPSASSAASGMTRMRPAGTPSSRSMSPAECRESVRIRSARATAWNASRK